jgi:O-antigen/teichoic acid export membrane protein
MLTGLSLQVILLADRFFLEYFRSLNEVGIYAIGVALAAGLGLVTSAFQMAFGPYSMSIQHQPDARVTYAHILTVFYALAAGGAVVLSLFAREALLIVSTPAYEGARFVVPYLAFYVVGVSLSYIASLGSWLAKRTDNLAWTTFVGAVVNLALHLALIPPFGIVGAGIATLAAQGVYVALLFWASQRCYPIPYRWREVFWISALSALVIAGGQFADQLSLVNGLTLKLLLACFFPLGLVLTGVIEPALIGRVVGRLVARQSES